MLIGERELETMLAGASEGVRTTRGGINKRNALSVTRDRAVTTGNACHGELRALTASGSEEGQKWKESRERISLPGETLFP